MERNLVKLYDDLVKEDNADRVNGEDLYERIVTLVDGYKLTLDDQAEDVNVEDFTDIYNDRDLYDARLILGFNYIQRRIGELLVARYEDAKPEDIPKNVVRVVIDALGRGAGGVPQNFVDAMTAPPAPPAPITTAEQIELATQIAAINGYTSEYINRMKGVRVGFENADFFKKTNTLSAEIGDIIYQYSSAGGYKGWFLAIVIDITDKGIVVMYFPGFQTSSHAPYTESKNLLNGSRKKGHNALRLAKDNPICSSLEKVNFVPHYGDILDGIEIIDNRKLRFKGEEIAYEVPRVLGKGSYGNVSEIRFDHEGQEYRFAIKEISEELAGYGQLDEFIIMEDMPATFDCNGVLNMKKSADKLLMPIASGDLEDLMGKVTHEQAVSIVSSLAQTLNCLAVKDIYYMDIKPANVVFFCYDENTFEVALADIGSVKPDSDNDYMSTFPPPEYSDGFVPASAVANFSRYGTYHLLGIYIALMTSEKPPLFYFNEERDFESKLNNGAKIIESKVGKNKLTKLMRKTAEDGNLDSMPSLKTFIWDEESSSDDEQYD
jgi:serine/threonine protein kinase